MEHWKIELLGACLFGAVLGSGINLYVWRWEKKHGRRIDGFPGTRNIWKGYKNDIAGTAVTLFLAYLVIWLSPYLKRGIDFALGVIGLRLFQLLIGAVVVMLGGIAYIFKQLNLKWYGRVEVIFAAASAIIAARQINAQTNWITTLAALGGCMYVVARGFSNTADAKRRVLEEAENKRSKEHDNKIEKEFPQFVHRGRG